MIFISKIKPKEKPIKAIRDFKTIKIFRVDNIFATVSSFPDSDRSIRQKQIKPAVVETKFATDF